MLLKIRKKCVYKVKTDQLALGIQNQKPLETIILYISCATIEIEDELNETILSVNDDYKIWKYVDTHFLLSFIYGTLFGNKNGCEVQTAKFNLTKLLQALLKYIQLFSLHSIQRLVINI